MGSQRWNSKLSRLCVHGDIDNMYISSSVLSVQNYFFRACVEIKKVVRKLEKKIWRKIQKSST